MHCVMYHLSIQVLRNVQERDLPDLPTVEGEGGRLLLLGCSARHPRAVMHVMVRCELKWMLTGLN